MKPKNLERSLNRLNQALTTVKLKSISSPISRSSSRRISLIRKQPLRNCKLMPIRPRRMLLMS